MTTKTKARPASAGGKKKSKSKSASAKTAAANRAAGPKPWGDEVPYELLRDLPYHHEREIQDLWAEHQEKIYRLERELAFSKTQTMPLQLALTRRVEELSRAEKYVPQLPQIYDDDIAKQLAKIELTKGTYHKGKWQKKPTGAIPWAQLKKLGASDEEILRNLKHVPAYGAGEYDLIHKGDEYSIRFVTVPTDQIFVEGTPAVIAEVRRILQIPPAKAEGGKRTPTKKPAAKKKPARNKPRLTTSPQASPVRKGKGGKGKGEKATAEKSPAASVEDLRAAQDARAAKLMRCASFKPERIVEALALVDCDPEGYAKLKKRLHNKPTPAQVINELGGDASKTPGADADGSPAPRPRLKEPASGYAPKDWTKAESLKRDLPKEYAALAEELGGPPNTQEILVYLGGGSCDITQLATGKRPSKVEAAAGNVDAAKDPVANAQGWPDPPAEDLDPDFDAEEFAAREAGDVGPPKLANVKRNLAGVITPERITIRDPAVRPAGKNRKIVGVRKQ